MAAWPGSRAETEPAEIPYSPETKPWQRHRATATTATGAFYCVLGAAVMAITVRMPGLASPERRADLLHLLVGLPFFALFALLVVYGDRAVAWLLRRLRLGEDRAARLGFEVREKLVMLLTLSGLGRTFVFAANGLGWNTPKGFYIKAQSQRAQRASPWAHEAPKSNPERVS